MEEEKFPCGACHNMTPRSQFVGGVCKSCDEAGFWIDPAGGIHYDDPNRSPNEFDDPAAMYE